VKSCVSRRDHLTKCSHIQAKLVELKIIGHHQANRDQFKKIRRLRGSKNFISEREKLVLTCSLTFSQCRDLSTGVMCENLGDLTSCESFGFVKVDLSENLVDRSVVSCSSQVWSER